MNYDKPLVFATKNSHKLQEIGAIIGDRFPLYSLKDIDCHDEIPETSNTIQGNALQKARYIYRKYGKNCFADDTALEVDALGGEPGIYSARYAGEGHDSEANMCKLLQKMEGINQRNAQFRTVIALIIEGKEYLFEGKIKGTLLKEGRGGEGFGYDPLFVPDGYDRTFAQLGDEIKNKISHRSQAIAKLIQFLT